MSWLKSIEDYFQGCKSKQRFLRWEMMWMTLTSYQTMTALAFATLFQSVLQQLLEYSTASFLLFSVASSVHFGGGLVCIFPFSPWALYFPSPRCSSFSSVFVHGFWRSRSYFVAGKEPFFCPICWNNEEECSMIFILFCWLISKSYYVDFSFLDFSLEILVKRPFCGPFHYFFLIFRIPEICSDEKRYSH